MSHLPGKFIWFEHVASDLGKARAFYQPLFNWHIEPMPMGEQTYHMILNGNEGIGGFRAARPGEGAHWASYLSVNNVDASFRAATAAGAKPLAAPADFPPVGRGAALQDPTGALLWLWRSHDGDRPDTSPTPTGDWYWNELCTHDARKALAFYEAVFGYGHDVMTLPDQGLYYVLKGRDGHPRAGLFQSHEAGSAPAWLPYVAVADCDASAAEARRLGARAIAVPPTDIPGVGRFAVLIDPFGAQLALIKPVAPTA